MSVECTLQAYSQLDPGDIEAAQEMLDACTSAILSPELWWWMLGLTVFFIAVGALIGWRKGRLKAGIIWSAVLGPLGWLVVVLMSPLPKPPVASPGLPRAP
ncbi:MAG: hypothetical protein ABIR16_01895 [Dokdonella sp.]